jgi:uncharacterized protein YbjT (DUF2867 family)
MSDSVVVIAGATGNLGGRIARAARERGAGVRALVRSGTATDRIDRLRALGVEVAVVDFDDPSALAKACAGASCVVSALSGLQGVIVDTQTRLVQAAAKAGVARFIPSDFSIDFTRLPPGTNRNLDLRRQFHERLDQVSIAATTIFNGAFADMLTGRMPLILFKRRRILCWGNPDQRMDFTTIEDTAAYTARAALDPSTPRFLRIAGDELSARELAALVSDLTGRKFGLLRPGGLGVLGAMIKIARSVAPAEGQLYPAWQGMQYLRNMLDGRAKMAPLDNDRYPDIRWTKARDVLSAALG